MLKKFTIAFCCLLFIVGQTYSQRTYNPEPLIKKERNVKLDQRPIASPRGIMDTLVPGAFLDTCSLNVFAFTITDQWGFLAGTNGFGDLEKAQRFTFADTASSYTIPEVWVFFSDARVVDDGDVTVNIYESTMDGAPASLVGTSIGIPASGVDIDPTAVVATIFTFDTPPTVTTPQFFASVDLSDLYAKNDTVGILTTDDNCGDGADSWELFGDGTTWTAIDASNSWQLEANYMIFAITEFDDNTTSVEDPFVSDKGLKLFPATPNPASNHTLLNYELSDNSEVSIEIYSADGRLIQTIQKGQQLAGPHQERIALDQFPAGQYVYGIVSGQSRLMSKFVVSK
ncbi:MAG: T9SS type A sorting domain-containing protein [Bacteroidota bacterium]